MQNKELVGEEMPETSTHSEGIAAPDTIEVLSPKLTGEEESTNTSTTPVQTNIQPPAELQANSPKMGDTRIVDGQKQVYFLGFGWIDDNDEPNQGTYAADMYENGNKIGKSRLHL